MLGADAILALVRGGQEEGEAELAEVGARLVADFLWRVRALTK